MPKEGGGRRVRPAAYLARRAARVLPAIFLFTLSSLALQRVFPTLFAIKVDASLFSMLFLYVNYTQAPVEWGQAHLWALCVEEHAILLLTLMFAAAGRRAGQYIVLALVPVALSVRWLTEPSGPPELNPRYWPLYTQSHLHLYAVLLGVLLALFEDTPTFERAFARVPRHPAIWVVIAALWALLERLSFTGFSRENFGLTRLVITPAFWNIQPVVTPTFMALLVAFTQRSRQSLFTRLLASRALRGVGALYLSIYLWQQPFTVGFLTAPVDSLQLIKALVLIALAATASYAFVERPTRRFLSKREATAASTDAEMAAKRPP